MNVALGAGSGVAPYAGAATVAGMSPSHTPPSRGRGSTAAAFAVLLFVATAGAALADEPEPEPEPGGAQPALAPEEPPPAADDEVEDQEPGDAEGPEDADAPEAPVEPADAEPPESVLRKKAAPTEEPAKAGEGDEKKAKSVFDARVFNTPPVPEGEESDWLFRINPEYRARLIQVTPLEVNGVVAKRVGWTEQRLRLDMTMARTGLGAIFVQADVLDGVLFGDNGDFGRPPEPSSGMGITAKQGNMGGWTVGLLPGRDPLELRSYGPILQEIQPLEINFLYGEVMLPFGLIRVGRQPLGDTATVAINDGRTGRNRWGASWYHESVDRILFATKISEGIKVLTGQIKPSEADRSFQSGVFWGIAYDYIVEDNVHVNSDDLTGIATQLQWRIHDAEVGPYKLNGRLAGTLTHRFDDRYNTGIFATPISVYLDWGPIGLEAHWSYIFGSTQELSAGFSELTGDPILDQDLDAMGARVTLDFRVGDFTFVADWGYAKGDSDPDPATGLTTFSWPRDTNLGLLLFEHILAFQSARSAAVGIENLKQLEAESFPLTELATEGRASNVNALWPQIFYEPVDGLLFKAGVLFAFSQTDTVDAVQTVLALDGVETEDDALNYHGGKPGDYWGTEIDLGVRYRYRDFFQAEIEAAYLFPGNGLRDENGDAVDSWLIESRLTFKL